jgi:CBS-domain-containing membrane protein
MNKWEGKRRTKGAMTVESLMSRNIQACHPSDSLHEAARLMWDHDCGCVPVVADEQVIGMLTDRDVCMAAYTQSKPLCELTVSTAMSPQVCSCNPDDSPSAVQELMATRQVRRLPVIKEDGRLVGIVSLSDLLRAAATAGGQRKTAAMSAEVGHTLMAICCRTTREAKAPAA